MTGQRGPAVVALGGGHGLAASLRAASRYAGTVTAVVSVADDGGSSGRLRESMAIPAPGDLRRCISALAPDDSMLGSALEYRFPAGDLAGHALGNLLIAGLAEASGSFVDAVDEVCRLVGVPGRVLPAAVEPITLVAEAGGTSNVEGQVAVQNTRGIRRLRVRPERPDTPAEVVAALEAADQVIIGPGSLFTSVLAVVMVPGVRRALQASRARKVFVANLRPQDPEAEGLTVVNNLDALLAHRVPVDVMLCHEGTVGADEALALAVPCVQRALATATGRAHDPELLAAALVELT